MTEQTKAPERIWAWPDDVEDGFMAASLPDNPPTKEYVGGSHIDYVRADLAAEQVREAHERAERAIKALSDLDGWVNHAMASLHRDIDMEEKLERADDIACDWFGSGWGASIRDELRALKSDDTSGG